MISNLELARRVIDLAIAAGARHFCLCAGSRNSPLVAAATPMETIEIFSFFDERSAAFFALGLAKRESRPVAVVTTSGTAAAELLPAAVEAHYSGVPLILITADRPRRFRGTGAPQAIEQVGIFTSYAEACLDLDGSSAPGELDWSRRSPLHINVAFDEPLLDRREQDSTHADVPLSTGALGPGFAVSPRTHHPVILSEAKDPLQSGANRSLVEGILRSAQNDRLPRSSRNPEPGTLTLGMTAKPRDGRSPIDLQDTLESFQRPLVLLGCLGARDRDATRDLALRLGAPVYAEPLSGLREDRDLGPLLITAGERMIPLGGFDGVFRIGGVPALRFWRDLEGLHRELPVISLNDLPFSGLSRGDHLIANISETLRALSVRARPNAAFHERDRSMATKLREILRSEPASELAMIEALSRLPAGESFVFLGNSLPVREWDLVADRSPRGFDYGANRGANGIDGELSSFFGQTSSAQENWAVLGDLTTLYDLSAPWIVPQMGASTRLRIVVVNNGGGRIFSRVPALSVVDRSVRERIFENAHAIGFEGWAAMWNLSYHRWTEVPSTPPAAGRVVIEIVPEAEASRRIWERYDALWKVS